MPEDRQSTLVHAAEAQNVNRSWREERGQREPGSRDEDIKKKGLPYSQSPPFAL